MSELTVLAEGLRFPEGPIALPDGSVLVVEIARGTLSRVANGEVTVVADLGGGPNGAAIGPDGHCYVCNNGGFQWIENRGRLFPGEEPENYSTGRIEKVDDQFLTLKVGNNTTIKVQRHTVGAVMPKGTYKD